MTHSSSRMMSTSRLNARITAISRYRGDTVADEAEMPANTVTQAINSPVNGKLQ